VHSGAVQKEGKMTTKIVEGFWLQSPYTRFWELYNDPDDRPIATIYGFGLVAEGDYLAFAVYTNRAAAERACDPEYRKALARARMLSTTEERVK
jgi:hypothetical protein